MSVPILRIRDSATGEWTDVIAIVGPPGHTPQKGVDYYTEEDKQQLLAELIAMLPSAESEVF